MNRTKQYKIVVLEQDEGIKESLKLILGDENNLFVTDNPYEISDYLGSQGIDLFIFDIDGFTDALGIIKEAKIVRPDVKILLLSINFELHFQEETARTGIETYFQEKPFNPKDLKERISRLIEGLPSKNHTHIFRIKRT